MIIKKGWKFKKLSKLNSILFLYILIFLLYIPQQNLTFLNLDLESILMFWCSNNQTPPSCSTLRKQLNYTLFSEKKLTIILKGPPLLFLVLRTIQRWESRSSSSLISQNYLRIGELGRESHSNSSLIISQNYPQTTINITYLSIK